MDVESKTQGADPDRRAFLSTAGKFAIVTPPAMSLLLSTTMTSPAIAASGMGKVKGNNGVGNGVDPQPPGNPPVNDGPGTGPGNPGNQGGGHGNGGGNGNGNGKGGG